MNKESAIRILRVAAVLALASVLPLPASAQVQRSFVNLGFEQPALTPNGCWVQLSSASVPGWDTTHTSQAGGGSCTSPASGNGPLIELWRNLGGVGPRSGLNHAELNAEQNSRIYQTVCLVDGEQIGWQFSHRGRGSATTADEMDFNIGPSASGAGSTRIVRAADTNTGAGAGATLCVAGGTCTRSATATNGWRDYSGSFTWNGGSGSQTVGFQAISSAGGIASGNFIDDIQLTLRPFVELKPTAASDRESVPNASLPTLSVSGNVTTEFTVTISVQAASTATLASDYTTPGGGATFTVTVPVNNYDGGASSQIPLGINILNDAVVENNETILLQIQSSAANYTIANTTTCGGASAGATSYTILDNDVDVRTTKSVNTPTPAPGGTAVFTVTYQNNTARPTVGTGSALTMHDAAVTLADALPTGFTAFSWTCAASGTPAPTCPAASGTGPINTAATLPAGNGSAAGGILTYTITGTIAATQCTSTTNTSTITANAPVQEATSSQSGFDTPVPGGTANNTATASVDPLCSDLAIFKTNTPASGPSDQVSDTVTSGTATTYSLRVVNIGPDAVTNARVTDTPNAGITCPGALGSTTVTCNAVSSPAGATVCPAAGVLTTTNLFGATGIVIPSIGVSPTPATPNNFVTLTFACTVN